MYKKKKIIRDMFYQYLTSKNYFNCMWKKHLSKMKIKVL